MSELESAIRVAVEAHAGQRDKQGQPYILHPLRVMLAFDDDLLHAAAVLHDVLEDTPVTAAELRERGLSEAVIEIVETLTKRTTDTYDA